MTEYPYRSVITVHEDLITTYEEIRAGFVALALEKNRQATPFVEEARALKARASYAKSADHLTKDPKILPALLAAAGVSDKAAGHMLTEDKEEAIKGLIEGFLVPAGEEFVEELVFRFLLTKGDALGGSMRNIGGVLAERKFSRSILGALKLAERNYKWLDKRTGSWIPMSDNDVDIELTLKGITWSTEDSERTLIYNITIPLIQKNVDISVFNCAEDKFSVEDNQSYLAIGELKGGIDPAGADEHWKTASKALARVREGFAQENLSPHTFFVAAAIASSMAQEIWVELESGTLSNAANLNNADQVASLCRWIVDL